MALMPLSQERAPSTADLKKRAEVDTNWNSPDIQPLLEYLESELEDIKEGLLWGISKEHERGRALLAREILDMANK